MIEYEICIGFQSQRVRRLDEVEQVGLGTEPRRHAVFLIKLAEIVVIVWVVAHRFPARCLVCRRKPQRGKTCLRNDWQSRFDEAPPLVFEIFRYWTIPIKCLQHHTHNSPSFSALTIRHATSRIGTNKKQSSHGNVTNECAQLRRCSVCDESPSLVAKRKVAKQSLFRRSISMPRCQLKKHRTLNPLLARMAPSSDGGR